MGPGVDNNFTLCSLQSRLQHIFHGEPYARVVFIPRSRTLIWPHTKLAPWAMGMEESGEQYIVVFAHDCYGTG
jgi:hypothetical protein